MNDRENRPDGTDSRNPVEDTPPVEPEPDEGPAAREQACLEERLARLGPVGEADKLGPRPRPALEGAPGSR